MELFDAIELNREYFDEYTLLFESVVLDLPGLLLGLSNRVVCSVLASFWLAVESLSAWGGTAPPLPLPITDCTDACVDVDDVESFTSFFVGFPGVPAEFVIPVGFVVFNLSSLLIFVNLPKRFSSRLKIVFSLFAIDGALVVFVSVTISNLDGRL